MKPLMIDSHNKRTGHTFWLTRYQWLHILDEKKRIRPGYSVSFTKGALFTRWFILSLWNRW